MKKNVLLAMLMAVLLAAAPFQAVLGEEIVNLRIHNRIHEPITATPAPQSTPTPNRDRQNQNQRDQSQNWPTPTPVSKPIDDLWFGGKPGDGGKPFGNGWHFEPATNTLELNGLSYSGAGQKTRYDNGATCASGFRYDGSKTLNLVLTGENSIEIKDANVTEIDGILCRGNLTVSGSGSLTVKAGACDQYSIGIWCDKNITIAGGAVTAEGGKSGEASYGVCSNGQITVAGGKLAASAGEGKGDSIGVWCKDDFVLRNGSVRLMPGKAGVRSYGIYIDNGSGRIEGGTLDITANESNDWSCGIWCNGGFAMLDGDVSLAAGKGANCAYGLYANTGDVTVKGGSLKAAGGQAGSYSFGLITANGNVRIEDGTVDITARECNDLSVGIWCSGEMTVNGGDLNAEGGTALAAETGLSGGIYATSSITVNGGKVTGTAKKAANSQGISADKDVIISGGSVLAVGEEASVDSYGIWITEGTLEIGKKVSSFSASGFNGAVSSGVKTGLSGTGWKDAAGTMGETAIKAGAAAQKLSFLKIELKP